MAESQREEIAKLEALYAGNPGGRVFVHLAEAYRKAGEHERARRILDEGLARHTDSASGYVVLGRVLADMQITAEAEVAFRRVLELDGGNLVALRWLGDLARQSGRNAEAASHYRELLIRNPSNEEVRELVEAIDREATSPGLPAGDESASDDEAALTLEDTSAPTEDAFATMDADAERDEPALEGAATDGDDAALEGPAGIGGTAPDVSAWSSAPGETTDAVDSGVEYRTVDDQVGDPAADVYTGTFESMAFEADVVADVDDEGLDPDDLRRDDEAEPLEIHLLDAAYDGREEDEDEYVSDLDVSDLASGGSLPDADDYADETFVADLSAAGTEEPPPDELPGGVDVMDAGEALTLLSDEGQDAPAPQPADGVASSGAGAWPGAGTDRHEPAGEPGSADADEVAELAGAAEPAAEWRVADADEPAAEWEMVEGDEAAEPDSEPQMAELAGAAEPASESHMGDGQDTVESGAEAQVDVRAGAETGLMTETMAVLYRSQGFHDRAAEVYRSLLRSRPGDERLQGKLREAEEAAAGSRSRQTVDDETGEVWLRGVGAAWTAPDQADSDATPYAWTADADDVDAGDPIGTYLQDLISWKAGSGGWRPAETPESAPEAGGGTDELPDWLSGPGGESEPWTPDSEPEPVHTASTAPNWSPPDSGNDPDPWDSAPAASREDEAVQAESTQGDEWQMPSDPGVAQPADADDTGGGWTPMDLDSDLPAGTVPSGSASDDVSPAAHSAEDDSSDDDDLEMFRSWLQSLKK